MKKLMLLFAGLALSGCIMHSRPVVSTTSLGPNEKPIAVVSGEASAWYFLGMGNADNNALTESAVWDAKSKAKADSMANVFVDLTTRCIPFWGLCLFKQVRVNVHGTAIKYSEPLTNFSSPKAVFPKSGAVFLTKPALKAYLKTLEKGDKVTVYLKDGQQITGTYSTHDVDTLWVKVHGGWTGNKAIYLKKINGIEKLSE